MPWSFQHTVKGRKLFEDSLQKVSVITDTSARGQFCSVGARSQMTVYQRDDKVLVAGLVVPNQEPIHAPQPATWTGQPQGNWGDMDALAERRIGQALTNFADYIVCRVIANSVQYKEHGSHALNLVGDEPGQLLNVSTCHGFGAAVT